MNKAVNYILFIFLFLYISLIIIWATDPSTDEKFLGGVDWSDNIFNWHPILMTLGFGLFFFQAIVCNSSNQLFDGSTLAIMPKRPFIQFYTLFQ